MVHETSDISIPSNKSIIAIDPNVGAAEPSGLDYEVEKLALKAQETLGREQVISAKEDFFVKAGKIHPEDPFYHARINYFLDTLLFEKILNLDYERLFGGRTFFDHLLESRQGGQPSVTRVRHGLFQIDKIRQEKLLIHDLFAKETLVISQRPGQSFEGLARKQIFQGFIYFTETSGYLSKGIFLHPDKVNGLLRKYVKKQLKNEDFAEKETLLHLARQHMRHLRHPHVDARQIYAEPKK